MNFRTCSTITQRIALFTFLIIITIILIAVFIVRPTILDILNYGQKIQRDNMSLEHKYINRKNIKYLIGDLKIISRDLEPLYEKMVIKKGSEVEFVSELEKTANKFNLIQDIQITPLKEKIGLAEKQDILITLSGSSIDTLKYIEALEHSHFYIYINSINWVAIKTSAKATQKTIKTNLYGYTYFSE